MVFKTLHLLRPSLSKTLTHGYAQSVVAATQSSYAAQNNSFPFRFKPGQPQHHAFSTANQSSATGSKIREHVDSGLAAYYEAWQKLQRTDNQEWKQFQFAKRIEWKPAAVVAEAKANDLVAIEETDEPVAAQPPRNRSHSASAVEDIRKQSSEQHIVTEIASNGQTAAGQHARAEDDAFSIAESAQHSPISSTGETLVDSIFSKSSDSTAISEADHYAAQLTKLADKQHYAEIPAVFEGMLVAGVKPTASAYNALLIAAIKLPRGKHQVVPKALDVYSDMLRRRVLPDLNTYSILIELLSSRALSVMKMKKSLGEKRVRYGGMEEAGKFMFRSSETEWDILSEDDSLNLAVKLFDASSTINLKGSFTDATYNLLISACAQEGRIEDMVRLYSHMESQNVVPLADMFIPMIHAFGSSGDLRSAVECYDEYKALAVAHDAGDVDLIRKDADVYAALIKAYVASGRQDAGLRFQTKIETEEPNVTKVVALRDTVGMKALLPEWLERGAFKEALDHASMRISDQWRDHALSRVCIRAADKNNAEIATTAYNMLSENAEISAPALALGAMHIRNGSIDAAAPYCLALDSLPARPAFIEHSTMHTVALIGSGNADQGLHRSRNMYAKVRGTQSSKQAKVDVVEQIDESIEMIGLFMAQRGIVVSPSASMELLWSMVENGGLVTPVAAHLLATMGPEHIAQLGWEDLSLLMQVQAGMIINVPRLDIAHGARFAHLFDVLLSSGTTIDKQTISLIEKALTKLERPDLIQRWQQHTSPIPASPYSPANLPGSFFPSPTQAAPTFEDSYDPYAATTDNKGSVAITDLLEKPHGRSAAHLNEALIKFKNMRRAGRHPRFFTYAKLISAAAKENRLSLAQDILALAKQDVPFQAQYRIVRFGWVTILDAMVAACLTTGRRDLAAQYHHELLSMGAAPSANTFGLYITTLKESTKTFDEATEAVKIFLRAKSEGVEPSSFLYNALIGKLGKARRIDDCLFYFAEMRNLGIRPTSVTYGTIVNALCRVSDEKFAEELFEEMESMPNYKPRPAPYHSLMQFFLTTKRDRSKVLAYYERMRSKNIQPTAHTYKLLIDTYATLEPIDMPAAEAVLEQIRQSGETPEAVHYSSLVHAKGCVLHDMEGARALFDSVLADGRIRPQACLYQALFEAMVANHRIVDTEAILAGMKSHGVEMTPYIANSLIHGWAQAKDLNKAKAIYNSVSVEKREPSTYEAMTRAYMALENRDGAMAVVDEALSRGYPTAVANKIVELVTGGRTSMGPEFAV